MTPRTTKKPAATAQAARRRRARTLTSLTAVAAARVRPGSADLARNVFTPALHPPSVTPKSGSMAMDDATTWAGAALSSQVAEGVSFIGYPALAEMAQRPEYRRISEITARHMTRKWIRLLSVGEDNDGQAWKDKLASVKKAYRDADPQDAERLAGIREDWDDVLDQKSKQAVNSDKADKIAKIEAAMKHLNVREAFRKVAEQDGFFGRGHIYIDLGTTDDSVELSTNIGNGRNKISQLKVGKGSLRRLKTVEAVWTYPTNYNTSDPLSDSWYRPDMWLVMGTQIHASRLLTFIGREVPDLLKSAYSFGGLSLSQMAMPYVDNWLRTRQSVADIVNAFSVMVLKTTAVEGMANNGQDILNRADFFNLTRDNRGLMIVDKDSEDFENVSAPLGGLHELQAQAQEHMASVSGIPLIFLLGIQPAGLNATSEGEIKSFYESIHGSQETLFRPNLTKVIDFIQLSEFGEVDPDITFEFEPLFSLDDKDLAELRQVEAQTDAAYIDAGVLSVEEVRQRLSDDPESPYQGLDPDDVPTPPMGEMMGGPPAPGNEQGQERDKGETPAAEPAAKPETKAPLAGDATFREDDHIRDHGKFATKAGSGATVTKQEPGESHPEGGGSGKSANRPALKSPHLQGKSDAELDAMVTKEASREPMAHKTDEQIAREAHEATAEGTKQAIGNSRLTPENKQVLQNTFDQARAQKPAYDQAMHQIARQMDGKALLPDIKSIGRSLEKIHGNYKGDAAQLKDVLRGTIAVKSQADYDKAIALVEKHFKITETDREAKSSGYHDVNMKVEINGCPAEIQINTPKMLAAKEVGHVLYEKYREIAGAVTKEERKATPEEAARLDHLNDLMLHLYSKAQG